MEPLYILIKDESLEIVNGRGQEWKPDIPHKRPVGQPIVHFLYGEEQYDCMAMSGEFKKVCPKSLIKRKAYVCIPDDYSPVETRVAEDFLQMTGRVSSIVVFCYSLCVGIQNDVFDYIAVTATKRVVTLNQIVGGSVADREYLQWERAVEQAPEIIKGWGELPVYLCDPNHLLDDWADWGMESMAIGERVFIQAEEKTKSAGR